MEDRQRYENMMTGNEADLKFKDQIDNFDRASSHPDKADCDGIKEQVIKATSNL